MLLASDGLWDFYTPQEACRFVLNGLNTHFEARKARNKKLEPQTADVCRRIHARRKSTSMLDNVQRLVGSDENHRSPLALSAQHASPSSSIHIADQSPRVFALPEPAAGRPVAALDKSLASTAATISAALPASSTELDTFTLANTITKLTISDCSSEVPDPALNQLQPGQNCFTPKASKVSSPTNTFSQTLSATIGSPSSTRKPNLSDSPMKSPLSGNWMHTITFLNVPHGFRCIDSHRAHLDVLPIGGSSPKKKVQYHFIPFSPALS